MRIVPNLPAHQPPTTLAGYAKVIPAHDEKFCRYKIQLNINNLKEAQMTTFSNFHVQDPRPLWPYMRK